MRRLPALALSLLLIHSTANAQSKPAPEQPAPAAPANKAAAPAVPIAKEWNPGDPFDPVPEAEFNIVLNIYYSPMDSHGMTSVAYLPMLRLASEECGSWKSEFSKRSLIGSLDNIVAFTGFCGGAANLPDVCAGDVFVKVCRRKIDGTWESDTSWNRGAPVLRLKADTSLKEGMDRMEKFLQSVYPKHPKSIAAKAVREAAATPNTSPKK